MITHITPKSNLGDLIMKNPYIILVIDHFGLIKEPKDMTIEHFAKRHNINPHLLSYFCNIYSENYAKIGSNLSFDDISAIIQFLHNSHTFYKTDKYPEISKMIDELYHNEFNQKEYTLLKRFFQKYFDEVVEHLDYEDEIAFPYFLDLFHNRGEKSKYNYSAQHYLDHHTDIEAKLEDLDNLITKHISIKQYPSIYKKLIFGLFELKYDLHKHSIIEETVLVPLINQLEREE